jgi:hypothetical protein
VKLRLAGFVLTLLAVLVLLGSLVAGLAESPPHQEEVVELPVPRTPFVGRERIRVEVLNGAGVPGLAREVTRKLRVEGFDVVFYGNAARADRDSTIVVDRIGNPQAAEAVAQALGVSRIETVLDTTLYLEATVLLGRDLGEP